MGGQEILYGTQAMAGRRDDRVKVSIVGTGYVGLVTGLCLAELGNEVVCIDVVPAKVQSIMEGRAPIYEPGLDELLERHLRSGRFRATMDMGQVTGTDVTFIAVGTPSNEDGSLDLRYVRTAAEDIGRALASKDGYHVVVVKSTVTPTTTDAVVAPIVESSSGKRVGDDLGIASNPEFLKEGMAVDDFMNPDRVVIGASDERAAGVVRSLYSSFDCPILTVPTATAEMIKVASNSFLATKISFVNEVGNICKDMGIDMRQVAEGMGLDARIGKQFLRAGCGFGGSCFPKDVAGLAAEAERRGLRPRIMRAALDVNAEQPLRLLQLLDRRMDVRGRTVAVLGLAFKPFTDDIREASSLKVVAGLLARGASVRAYDPKAMDNFRREYPDVTYCSSTQECISGADVAIIVTEWPEFAPPELYGDMLVVDGRGVTRTKNYEGICW
jgi:UDPglucose 6-dehydrogenase